MYRSGGYTINVCGGHISGGRQETARGNGDCVKNGSSSSKTQPVYDTAACDSSPSSTAGAGVRVPREPPLAFTLAPPPQPPPPPPPSPATSKSASASSNAAAAVYDRVPLVGIGSESSSPRRRVRYAADVGAERPEPPTRAESLLHRPTAAAVARAAAAASAHDSDSDGTHPNDVTIYS